MDSFIAPLVDNKIKARSIIVDISRNYKNLPWIHIFKNLKKLDIGVSQDTFKTWDKAMSRKFFFLKNFLENYITN